MIGCAIFFRAKSYQLSTLLSLWHTYVLKQDQTVLVAGRCVLLGDHTHAPKDGGRMPGVVSMRERSETQSKPSYFRGQCWGALGLLVGSIGACFGLPLELRIDQGFVHLGHEPMGSDSHVGLGERVVRMALAFAVEQDRPAGLVLDAFFPTAVVFRVARSVYSVALKQPYLYILVRAKKNYVGYFPAPAKPPHRPGPQARYGKKVHLKECFDHRHLFESTPGTLYGQAETVQLMALELLWKPLGEPLLFIFAITSRGPLMLMSSDLALSPATALELYCTRARIEIMFAMLKHVLGAVRFRFWTNYLPKHPRRPRANKHLQAPAAEHMAAVTACWNACEVFVGCATIAHGLLPLIALRFESQVWHHHALYLRTQSRALPSERTVKQVLAPQLLPQFIDLGQHGLIAKIQRGFDRAENDKEPDFRLSA